MILPCQCWCWAPTGRCQSRKELKRRSRFPRSVPSGMFGQGSVLLPGLVQALPAVASTSSAGTVGDWGLWTQLQSWRVPVPLSKTILDCTPSPFSPHERDVGGGGTTGGQVASCSHLFAPSYPEPEAAQRDTKKLQL